ncbi:IS66 family transposase [Pectinatus sottacetonis]|uniref:IS66 family transposase n=1 Tax=Pectinatus sottacetonis TaxID=1002795 RepID=UPI0018C5D0FB|nr:IS66 family transposase [Pectinatus sottacetonis]
MTDQREQEMQNRIDGLLLEKENLNHEVGYLKEQLAQLKKMAFGCRTEKTTEVLGDPAELNLFNEAEIEVRVNAPEPVIDVPAHQRHKKQKGHLEQLLRELPHEERLITLPEDVRICKRCGTPLTPMGKEKIRTEVQFIPSQVKVIDFYRASFQCLECRKQEHFSIEKPVMPQPVLAKSIASPSSVAHVITQKYQFSMPLYRQEQEWKAIGLALPRATLANWVIRAAEDWLMPLVDRMHSLLLEKPIIHADETPVQVLHEKGRKNKTKSYMWVYTNGEFQTDGQQIRIYEYHPGRSGSFAGEFLKDYKGILQTDGYAGYEQISSKEHALCWVHARRYFVDSIPAGLTKEDAATSVSGQAIQRINEFFALDKGLADKTPEARQAERLRLIKNKLEAFFAWLETIRPGTLPKSALGKAVNYTLNHKEGLRVFLKDGNVALSNNICERAIRNFTIGRKNWLFSASPKGAAASAAIYSIVETCKANGLAPFSYLTYLFERIPNMDFKIHPEKLDAVLPWTDEIQKNCK